MVENKNADSADLSEFIDLLDELPESFGLTLSKYRRLMLPGYARNQHSAEGFAQQQQIAKQFVEAMRSEYERTRNPLYALRAYSECRAWEIPIPEWAFEYLDDAIVDLLCISHQKPKDLSAAVMEALKLKRRGRSGRGTAFSNYMDHSALSLAVDVRSHIERGDKPDIAYDTVARERGVSRSTVQRAWIEFRGKTEDRSE